MCKIVVCPGSHAKSLHDRLRGLIGRYRERYDLLEMASGEGVSQHTLGRLGRITMAHAGRTRRQPISTAGVKWVANATCIIPTKPANGSTPGMSSTHSPKPCCSKCAAMRATMAAVSVCVSVAGK